MRHALQTETTPTTSQGALLMRTDALTPDTLPCDLSRKFVRVLQRRDNGLVEFEFSIGWPELAVELMLPAPAFEAFCATHQVEQLAAPLGNEATSIP